MLRASRASASATGVAPTTTSRRACTNGSTYTSTAPSETHVIGTTTCSAVDSATSPASGRIDTRRLHRVASDSSACCRTISREHAPPTNPSMRPSANTIARSPRCADTGARRATTVATANDCPSRRSAATCSKKSMGSCYQLAESAVRQPLEQPRGPRLAAARAGRPAAPETRPRRAAPPARRAPTRSRTGCSTARTSHHRATAPLSPADPDIPTGSALQAARRRTNFDSRTRYGSSVTTASLRTGGPTLDGKLLAQQRHELIGNDRELVQVARARCRSETGRAAGCGARCPSARSRDRSPRDPRAAG